MYYEKMKKMLERKKAAGFAGKFPEEPDKLCKAAQTHLGHISLRHYLGRLSPDTLLTRTAAVTNPLFYVEDEDQLFNQIAEGCMKANKMMADNYGTFVGDDPDEKEDENHEHIKEFVLWSALFPEKRAEL